jgi:hypothetical protein
VPKQNNSRTQTGESSYLVCPVYCAYQLKDSVGWAESVFIEEAGGQGCWCGEEGDMAQRNNPKSTLKTKN